jgi:hypothetical protein
MKKNSLIVAILLILVAGGAGFFGGMKFGENKIQSQFQGFRGQNGQRTGNDMTGARGTGLRPVVGTILSVDNGSMTVKLQDGSSKIVLISDKTEISKAGQATTADLKVGDTVSALGQTNSDGSVTAQNIQLNPVVRTPGASPSPTAQ